MHKLRSLVPSANYLFAFEAAARHLSFTAAARELNISQPAISKTIRALERATALELFRRERGRLQLTAEGRRLQREVKSSLDHLHGVISSLQRRRTRDVVHVSFSAAFVSLWLLPRLQDFKTRHPEVKLRIEESNRDDLDLLKENVDFSMRLGDGSWPGLQSWFFAAEEVIPVCSPSYLQKISSLVSARDLPRYRLLHFDEPHRIRIGWTEWLRQIGVPTALVSRDVVFSDAMTPIGSALLGQGIALGWCHLVDDHLKAGRLVRPVPESYRSGKAFYLVARGTRPLNRGAELFRDWLLACVRE